jgi:hypothetical protein
MMMPRKIVPFAYFFLLCPQYCIAGFGVDTGVLPLSTSRIELVTLQVESRELLRCQGAIPICLYARCEAVGDGRSPVIKCMFG